jgi:hypothetical protein
LTPAQKRQHVTAQQKNVEAVANRLVQVLSEGNMNIDKNGLNTAAKQLATGFENMLLSVRDAMGVILYHTTL